jgi:hypothetical protein
MNTNLTATTETGIIAPGGAAASTEDNGGWSSLHIGKQSSNIHAQILPQHHHRQHWQF